jgi:hypothetical protein
MPSDSYSPQLQDPNAVIPTGLNFVSLTGQGVNLDLPDFALVSGDLTFDADPSHPRSVDMLNATRNPVGGSSPYSFFSSAFRFQGKVPTPDPKGGPGSLVGVGRLRVTISNNPAPSPHETTPGGQTFTVDVRVSLA